MRIISQSRESDVNYDKCSIEYDRDENGKHVIAATFTYEVDVHCGIILGRYPTKQRCLDVMASINDSYRCSSKVHLMPEE